VNPVPQPDAIELSAACTQHCSPGVKHVMCAPHVFGGMLGVTLFGIVLTPVFFYPIDWLGDTHLFRTVWMQRLGSIALDVVTLRGVRKLGRLVVKPKAPKPAPTTTMRLDPPAPVNGEAGQRPVTSIRRNP
jgi:hypothetical protein